MGFRFHVPPGSSGCVPVVRPQEAGLKWLAFDMLRLGGNECWTQAIADEEMAVVCLSGRCEAKVEGRSAGMWSNLGGRADVFAGPPTILYVPRQSTVELRTADHLEAAIVRAPCEVDLPTRLISSDEVVQISSGIGSWRRDVRLLIPPGSPITQRLIIGETLHAPAQWSGWPPHKHDTVADDEHPLEEFYFYRTRPTHGFGVQLLYGPDGRRDALMVGHDDVVIFHNGYHPFVAGPGASCYYMWVLAGEQKTYKVTIDPTYRWAIEAEAIMKERSRF